MKKLYIYLLTLIIPFAVLSNSLNFESHDNVNYEIRVVDNWKDLKIYPNPSVAYVNIENAKNAVFEVYDVSGKLIFSEELHNSRFVLDVSNWKQGTYIFRFIGDQGVRVEKVMVK